MSNVDLRILNTTDQIKKSLLINIQEKPFRLITNNDIINQAGISPRTFYRYYKDKNDLLNTITQSLNKELSAQLKTACSHLENVDDLTNVTSKLLIVVLHYIYANKKLIAALLSPNGEISFGYSLRKIINDNLKETLSQGAFQDYLKSSKNTLIFNAFIDGKLIFIINWLNYTDTVSIQDAEKILQKDALIIEKED